VEQVIERREYPRTAVLGCIDGEIGGGVRFDVREVFCMGTVKVRWKPTL